MDCVLMDFVMVLLRFVFDCMVVCMYVCKRQYVTITQIEMNGPEAAAVMRKDLLYDGPIIGMLLKMPNIGNGTRSSDGAHMY